MKKQLYILSVLILILAGCQDDNELEKSVFIRDSVNPDLPAYSEWGYNTFGAYIDREIFVSNNKQIPAKVVALKDTMSFILSGQRGEFVNDKMSITFKISGITLEKYSDLIVLNFSTFNLVNPSNKVVTLIDSVENSATILSGELQFRRVQNLFVDKKQVEVILSGYFYFKAVINNIPYDISNGRFDVGIGIDNFYNLN